MGLPSLVTSLRGETDPSPLKPPGVWSRTTPQARLGAWGLGRGSWEERAACAGREAPQAPAWAGALRTVSLRLEGTFVTTATRRTVISGCRSETAPATCVQAWGLTANATRLSQLVGREEGPWPGDRPPRTAGTPKARAWLPHTKPRPRLRAFPGPPVDRGWGGAGLVQGGADMGIGILY